MKPTAGVAIPDRLWTPDDVAAFLGVPKATVYKWRNQGTGPRTLKVGRHLRYLPAEVLAWATAQSGPGPRSRR